MLYPPRTNLFLSQPLFFFFLSPSLSIRSRPMHLDSFVHLLILPSSSLLCYNFTRFSFFFFLLISQNFNNLCFLFSLLSFHIYALFFLIISLPFLCFIPLLFFFLFFSFSSDTLLQSLFFTVYFLFFQLFLSLPANIFFLERSSVSLTLFD